MNAKHRCALGLASFLFVGSGSLVASAAATDPDSSYPGTICHPYFTPTTDDPLVHGNSFLYNTSTAASFTVTCPIVSKNPSSSGGIQFAAVWVNNPAGKTTSCWLYSNPTNGSYVSYLTQSVSASGVQALYFNNLAAPGYWGNYTLQCSLPSGAYLYSYYVYQNP
jgi:hypothetical protein